MPLPRWAILVLALVTVVRVAVASHMPLNVDETYYRVWGLHPAYGYPDEPPMLGWLLWTTSFLGQSSLAVRLPFIICDTVAAVAIGRVAILISKSALAGGVAMLILLILPGPHWLLSPANPDAPFVCFWALALWVALRLERSPELLSAVALGLAMAGATLSRTFGWAVVIGIAGYALTPAGRALLKNGLWLALSIAVLLYVPFVAWNATHGWENFAFTFATRAGVHGFSIGRISVQFTMVLAAAIALFVAVVTLRRKHMLIAWTALPLATFLLILSPFYNTQSYWLLGPFTSIAADLGIVYSESRGAGRLAWVTAGAVLTAIAVASLFSTSAFAWNYITDYAYRPLAERVKAMNGDSATVLTDEYGIAAELYYNGVADPILIGSDPRGPQWRRWFVSSDLMPRAIVVAHHPMGRNDDLARRSRRAYARQTYGPTLHYSLSGVGPDTFYTTLCTDLRPGAATALFGD